VSYIRYDHKFSISEEEQIGVSLGKRAASVAGVNSLRKRKVVPTRIKNESLRLRYDPLATNYEFPTDVRIRSLHQVDNLVDEDKRYLQSYTRSFLQRDGIWYFKGKVWIPSSARTIMYSILITAHQGLHGHRSVLDTFNIIHKRYHWELLRAAVDEFCSHCLQCEKTKTGAIVPRPLGSALQATRANEVLHFDFCYIMHEKHSYHKYQYVLVLKDGFTGFVELVPCVAAEHVVVVDQIMLWCARFGIMEYLVSDQGSHFKNNVMTEFAKRMFDPQVTESHHFTMTYTPWANGTVERVNRDMLQLFRALTLERSIKFEDNWPSMTSVVMSAINSRPSQRLAVKGVPICPRKHFTGKEGDDPLRIYYNPMDRQILPGDIDWKTPALESALESLMASLHIMHSAVAISKRLISSRNSAQGTHRVTVNFGIGDFVLLAIPQPVSHKLEAIWRGPFVVIEILNTHLYRVRSLDGLTTRISHTCRLKFFADCDMDVTIPLIEVVTKQDMWISTYIPAEITDTQMDSDGSLYVLVRWEGFTDYESTWEPLQQFWADSPNLVHVFLEKNPNHYRKMHDEVRGFENFANQEAVKKLIKHVSFS
jgi:hypothetical protein